jgi:hypothetical protein
LTSAAQKLRLRGTSNRFLISLPLVYDNHNSNVPPATGRMVRIRLVRRGDLGNRGDGEGGSLLRFVSIAGNEVSEGGFSSRPSGKIGARVSSGDKSDWLGESPISRSRQSARRCEKSSVTLLYRVCRLCAALEPDTAPKGRRPVCLYLFRARSPRGPAACSAVTLSRPPAVPAPAGGRGDPARACTLGRNRRVTLSAAWSDPQLAARPMPRHILPSSQIMRNDRVAPCVRLFGAKDSPSPASRGHESVEARCVKNSDRICQGCRISLVVARLAAGVPPP